MKITAIKTPPVTAGHTSLAQLVDQHAASLPDRSILAVTSKIVSICEDRVIKLGSIDHEQLIYNEADYYRAPAGNPWGYHLTIKDGLLVGSAGVDQSNGAGHYVLWPADPQASANALRRHLGARTGHRQLGVIITDSRSTPLRRGAIGLSLAHSGFAALEDYAGRPDLFGRPLQHETANLADGLAAAAVAVMGEGAQSTPLALIEDLDFITFQDHGPTPAELAMLKISLEHDFFSEFLLNLPWDKRPSH